ncbi:Crp/Fnr family transcriptional regulator [Microvirga sp. KLBC 81]|uniref:Crp/Fnr family transcriptional regulator n=1 Tax=Microvirga sp. KLBC 81 TaxID=1862707 RepID=UPI000D523E76|nr:Crp/Fnr family transcriptional regulator [Microvirga sp. KLBC 81]PVE21448.1 Crp/Fnr family transcriptional regulator [Microvirga sp. KLBC 81]
MINHRENWLLSALEPDDFALVEPHLEGVELASGQVLYETGATIDRAYFPHDAMVSLVTIMKDGGTVEMAVFGREGVVGFASALTTRVALGRYLVQLPGAASRAPIEKLVEVFDSRPSLRFLFFRYIEGLLAQTFQITACNAVHGVEARCCRWLLTAHDRVARDELPLTHEFLAEMLGVQRPTVSIILRTLQTAGLITQRRGIIVIADREGLEEAACECYGNIRERFSELGFHFPKGGGPGPPTTA